MRGHNADDRFGDSGSAGDGGLDLIRIILRLGSGLGDLSSLPGGLWEVFVGVWLIVKGFNTPAIVSEPARAGRNMSETLHGAEA